ncbi:MAG: hypothetical protein IJZ46_05240 [Bacilli bacterium]|nr:hypothetical protein [Bacilli bacterium]
MKRIKWFNLIFSILLSLSINLKVVVNKSLDYFIKEFKFDFNFLINNIILSVIIYFILLFIFKLLDKIKIKNSNLFIDKNKKILVFFSIFITTIIFLLVYYPGVYLNDTYYMLYGPIKFSNGHPLFLNLTWSILFFTLKIYFSSSFSIFIMSFIQSIISAVVLTYIVVWFNKKIKNKTFTILLILYYIFIPIVSNYNMALNKDSIYTLMFLLFLTLYYEIIETKGNILSNRKFIFKLIIVSIFMMYTRNNGFYIIVPSMVVLLFVYGIKKYYKSILSFLVIISVLSFIPTCISKSFNVEYLKREKYALPIQQVCYLVKYYPDKLDKSDYDLLDKIIINSRETISNKYNVYKVDDIKFDSNFKDAAFNKYEKEFASLWLNKMPNNIDSYLKSYLLNNYHLWAIDELVKKQSVILEASITGLPKEHQVINKRILPKGIHNFLSSYYETFTTFFNPALSFIILFLFNVYSLYHKNKKLVIFSFPLTITWFGSLIVSPLSSALRYMAIYIYMLPIIIFLILKETRDKYE